MKQSAPHKALRNVVDAANTPSDLSALLSCLKLSDLQEFAIDKINEMDVEAAYAANDTFRRRHAAHSIFGYCNQHRAVCKLFNQLNVLNEENIIRSIYHSVSDQISGTKAPTIWILDRHRTTVRLRPIEKHFGFQGVLDNLSDAKRCCSPGSIVLVRGGSYECLQYQRYPAFKDVCFFGVGKSTISFQSEAFSRSGNVSFENLRVEIRGGGLRVDCRWTQRDDLKDSKVSFRNCVMEMDCGINVGEHGSLEIKNCLLFLNPQRPAPDTEYSAITVIPFANELIVTDSNFEDFAFCASVRWDDRHYSSTRHGDIVCRCG